jgi:Uri superfamily endonuclease
MPDYSLAKIYKLVSNKTPDIYIGSCLMRLSTRLSNHKSKSNKAISRKLFNDGAIITIVLIENYPCNTKNELKARELHYITTHNCINKNKPFVCDILCSDMKAWSKEYYQANAEQINSKAKEYNAKNAEHYKEYQTDYREANKEHRKEYDKSHRDRINATDRARYAKKKLAKELENALNNSITV